MEASCGGVAACDVCCNGALRQAQKSDAKLPLPLQDTSNRRPIELADSSFSAASRLMAWGFHIVVIKIGGTPHGDGH